MMRRLLTNVILAGLGVTLSGVVFAQATMPVIPAVKTAPAPRTVPVWQHDRDTVTVTADAHAADAVPAGAAAALDGRTSTARAGVRLTTRHGITAHADVDQIRFGSTVPSCAPGTVGCLGISPIGGVQRGEVGAGFAAHGVKLDLSLGHAQSDAGTLQGNARHLALPRVLPAAGGGDVAAPLWFGDSTSTSVNARGQLSLAPDTSLNVGASVGRIRFLPGSGAPDDSVDQTTLSFGIRHGSVRGSIVGHTLQPDLPGTLGANQRWSGVDLGISVRLPWRGELNFGAQNLWTSGRAPILFGTGSGAPDQGRVPYVQYHQDL